MMGQMRALSKFPGILGILHIAIAACFSASTIYIFLSGDIPYLLLLSLSGILAGFLSLPIQFNIVFPIILLGLSGAGVAIGLGLLRQWKWARIGAIALSVLYLPNLPFASILGIYTLCALSRKGIRFFGSVIVQFVLVGAVFWYFHWICPDIHEYCKQNPKTPKGIGPQIRESTAPLYSSPDLRIKTESDLVDDHSTKALVKSKQGKTDEAVKEFQRAIQELKRKKPGRFNTWLILPIIAAFVYFVTSRGILKNGENIPVSVLLVTVIGMKIGIDLSVSLVDGGFFTLGIPLSPDLEYYADVPKVEGIYQFLRDFNSLGLSLHSKTHPPGGALFLWIVARLFNYDLLTASFAVIAFSSLVLIPIYLLAKELYGEKIGRYALMLCLVTPNTVLFSATCTDAVFTVFLVWSIYLYFRALSRGPVIYGILTGVSLTLSMLMNFTTTTLGIYFIVLAIVAYIGSRTPPTDCVVRSFKRHAKVLLISGAVLGLLYLLLYLGPGYNVFTNLKIAIARDKSGMGTGYETIERYIFLGIANLFAFFIYVGVPTTALWLREADKAIREALRRKHFDAFLIAFAIWLVGVAFSTLFTLEVERIWMFMLPFILIPAGKRLADLVEKSENLGMFYATSVLLWIQVLAFEVLLNTRW